MRTLKPFLWLEPLELVMFILSLVSVMLLKVCFELWSFLFRFVAFGFLTFFHLFCWFCSIVLGLFFVCWYIWVTYGSMLSVVFVFRPSQTNDQPDRCPAFGQLPAVVCPSVLLAKTLILEIMHKLFNQILSCLPWFHSHWCLPFYTTLTKLDRGWGAQVSSKQNLLASFSPQPVASFQTQWDEILWWSNSS